MIKVISTPDRSIHIHEVDDSVFLGVEDSKGNRVSLTKVSADLYTILGVFSCANNYNAMVTGDSIQTLYDNIKKNDSGAEAYVFESKESLASWLYENWG